MITKINKLVYDYILRKTIKQKKVIKLKVLGNSMYPVIRNGEIVDIVNETFGVGDIILFRYKNTLIVHRLLKVCNNEYFCKGDNSFRIEKISFSDIIGKVIGEYINCLEFDDEMIALSFKINNIFETNKSDKIATINSNQFKLYAKLLCKKYKGKNNGIKDNNINNRNN